MGSADKETIFIRGPMGPRGERGPAGIDGVQGVDGAPGADGAPAVAISVPSSGWSWVNQGSATLSTNASKDVGSLYLRAPVVGGDSLRIRVRSLPAGKTAIVCFRPYIQPVAGGAPSAGICWRESSSGKLSVLSLVRNPAPPCDPGLYLPKYTNETAWSGGNYAPSNTDAKVHSDRYWMKMQDDGANRIFSLSVDGENFHAYHSVGRTDFLTADQFGFFANSNGFEAGIQILRWEES